MKQMKSAAVMDFIKFSLIKMNGKKIKFYL